MKSGWKRLARSESDMARKPGKRQPRRLLLVVCEDSKSAPNYFCALRTHLRLSTARIEVCGEECGSAPISVVDYAIQRKKEHHSNGHNVDAVYCVVDVDEHPTLHKAIDKAQSHKLNVAVSSPSFELWYLLHFEPGGRGYSHRDVLLRDLKAYLPAYDKGSFQAFEYFWDKTHVAIKHAKALVNLRGDDRFRNPSTEVHIVVEAFIAETQPKAEHRTLLDAAVPQR